MWAAQEGRGAEKRLSKQSGGTRTTESSPGEGRIRGRRVVLADPPCKTSMVAEALYIVKLWVTAIGSRVSLLWT